MVGISRPGVHSALLTVMHRHTCTCGPDTSKHTSEAVLHSFQQTAMQAWVYCLKTAVECCFRAYGPQPTTIDSWRQHLVLKSVPNAAHISQDPFTYVCKISL
jgi:hypothetical protein